MSESLLDVARVLLSRELPYDMRQRLHDAVRNELERVWIPTHLRLPEHSGDYIVTFASGLTSIAWFNAPKKLWGNALGSPGWNIKAWMPMPEPYLGDDNA